MQCQWFTTLLAEQNEVTMCYKSTKTQKTIRYYCNIRHHY